MDIELIIYELDELFKEDMELEDISEETFNFIKENDIRKPFNVNNESSVEKVIDALNKFYSNKIIVQDAEEYIVDILEDENLLEFELYQHIEEYSYIFNNYDLINIDSLYEEIENLKRNKDQEDLVNKRVYNNISENIKGYIEELSVEISKILKEDILKEKGNNRVPLIYNIGDIEVKYSDFGNSHYISIFDEVVNNSIIIRISDHEHLTGSNFYGKPNYNVNIYEFSGEDDYSISSNDSNSMIFEEMPEIDDIIYDMDLE